MRLFVALSPPQDVLDELTGFVAPHKAAWPELRWVSPDRMHITLAFLGEVDDVTFERLPPRLERAAGRFPKPTLSFAGAGAFPGSGARARVLWMGLSGDHRTLAGLAAAVTAAGRRAGAPGADHKTFHPHLTLARCRQPTDVRPLIEGLGGFAGSAWSAGAIHLIHSHPGAVVRYETLRTWSLC